MSTAEERADEEVSEHEAVPLAKMLAIGTVLSLIGVFLVLLIDWFPAQASTAAPGVDTLYDVLLIVSIPIFLLVMTVVVYSVMKFRARGPGDMRDGAPIHGNARLEVIWVTIPLVIVSLLAVYGWIVLDDQEETKANTMVVKVEGQQFAWHFQYPQPGGAKPVRSDDLVLPVARPVKFEIRAADVLHSFFIPAFRLKSDAVPGITTSFRATPNKEGDYDIVCAELCGIGHSTMRQTVSVVPEAKFSSWLAEQGKAGGEAAEGATGNSDEAESDARGAP